MTNTTTDCLVFRTPDRTTEPTQARRKMQAEWVVATGEDGKQYVATLNVSYNAGGMNYFNGRNEPRCYQASIGIESVEKRPIGEVRGFMLFSAIGFIRSEPVGRYSEKKLREFFPVALAALRARVEAGDEKILAVFDPAQAVKAVR